MTEPDRMTDTTSCVSSGREDRAMKHPRSYILAGLALVSVMLLGATAQVTRKEFDELRRQVQALQQEVRTRHIIVEDEQGTIRAELKVDEGGPGLWLSHENGSAVLAVRGDGPGLFLLDGKSTIRAGLTTGEDGAVLKLLDGKGKGGAALGVIEDGPGVALLDEKGTVRVALGVPENTSELWVSGEDGNVIWSAP